MKFVFCRFLGRAVACGFIFLIAQPANAQPAGNSAFVDFVEAVRVGDVAAVKRSLAAGQDVNMPDASAHKLPPLFHAYATRQFAVARVLIEGGANIRDARVLGVFPLGWAARAGDVEGVRLMLSKGADPRAVWEDPVYNYRGKTAIEEALAWGRLEVVKELEKAGVPWTGNSRGAYALFLACRSGDGATVEHLLANGADVNTPHMGNLPLNYAASMGDLPLIKLLLAKGAQVNGVSEGPALMQSWEGYRRTALMSAVIHSKPEAVSLLLQNGADPRALGNLAIQWADLMGDEQAFALLRGARAPLPEPFAYRAWLGRPGSEGAAPAEASRKSGAVSAPLTLNFPGAPRAVKGAALARETKFAIITTETALDNAESLLAVRLSQVENAVVLERRQLRAVLKERALTQNFGRSPVENSRLGQLLGADALVFLRSYVIEGVRMAEARIVSVSTGLVTAAMTTDLAENRMDAWAADVAGRCAADGERLFTKPDAARLVAVVPFTAALNNASSRELERQLELSVALRLAQLPGVFLVEREDLTRLQAEGRTEERALLNGSWVVQGAIEQSLNDATVSLRLAMKPGMGGAVRELKAAGTADAPWALSAAAVTAAAEVLDARPGPSWAAKDEAAEFLKQAEGFLGRRMWQEAEMTATAARALGRDDDRVRNIRIQAAANRILFSSNYYDEAKRKQGGLSGPAELVSRRAPLLMSVADDRELQPDDYFEKAGLVLDLLEPTLERTDATIAGKPYAEWVCGRVWDAATQALRVTEALSYQSEYGERRAELRGRLLALSTKAMQQARARRDAKALHSLIALRCKHLCWWIKDDAGFQAEVLRLLGEAKGWPPPLSEHAVWGPVFMIAEEHMAIVSGRASESWVRLVQSMAKSTDVRERFFGAGLQALDDQRNTRIESAVPLMMQDFKALVEIDQSIPARVLAVSYKPGPEPSEGSPFECWYYQQTQDLFANTAYSGVFSSFHMWIPAASVQRLLPEKRQFYVPLAIRRFTLIGTRGPSGYFKPMSSRELTREEATALNAASEQAKLKFEPLIALYPEVKSAVYAIGLATFKEAAGEKQANWFTAAPVVMRAPRMPFEQQISGIPEENKDRMSSGLGEKSFRDFDQNVWFVGQLYGRTAVYAFSEDGTPGDEVWGPSEQTLGYRFYVNASIMGRADRSSRYIAGAGSRIYPDGRGAEKALILYDATTKTWKDWVPPQTYNEVHDLKLFGNTLVYTFLNNPLMNAAGSKASDDNEKRGDPLFGVMRYDIATGKHDLLVSNRRNPAESPIDGPGRENRQIIRVSAEEFMIGKSETHVFNTQTGTWRPVTPEDRTRAKRFNDQQLVIGAAGTYWWAAFDRKKGLVLTEARRPNTRFVVIPMTFEDTDALTKRLLPYRTMHYGFTRAIEGQTAEPVITPQGVVLKTGPAYYWMPKAQLNAIVTEALKPADKSGDQGSGGK